MVIFNNVSQIGIMVWCVDVEYPVKLIPKRIIESLDHGGGPTYY